MSAIINPATVPQKSPGSSPAARPGSAPASGGGWKWLIGAILLAGAGWLSYDLWLKPKNATPTVAVATIHTARAVKGALVKTIRVAGQTSARSFVNVTAPILRGPESGILILMKLAKSGAAVRKGELMAEIDAQNLKDHLDDMTDTIEAAEADVKRRQAEQAIEWANLEQTLRIAKSNWEKAKLEAGAAEVKTAIDQELLKLDVDEAQAAYDEIRKDLANKKAAHEAELKTLQITVERHKRHRGRHESDLQKFTVYAAMDGLVVMQSIFRGGEMAQVQQGDQVYPGQPFMKLVNVRSMQIEGSINQSESSMFRLGQEARIGLDAFPGVELKGHVYSVGALAVGGYRQNFYIRGIPVRIAIDQMDQRVIPDLSAYADVKVGEVKDAVLIPVAAVRTESGKSFVEVRQGERFERRAIETGLSNGLQVAVVSGVSPGDEVVLAVAEK